MWKRVGLTYPSTRPSKSQIQRKKERRKRERKKEKEKRIYALEVEGGCLSSSRSEGISTSSSSPPSRSSSRAPLSRLSRSRSAMAVERRSFWTFWRRLLVDWAGNWLAGAMRSMDMGLSRPRGCGGRTDIMVSGSGL